MTEPLPCPFCGHVGLSQYEGSTFRWLATECNGCGAQCGEERIDTMTMERSAAIEQAKVAAIETWNTRAAQPEQQAEPVQEPVSMRMPKVGDRIVCLEDESLGKVVSLTAGGSPDILFDDGSHGTYLLREFAELFGYAEQRQPLTKDEALTLEALKYAASKGDGRIVREMKIAPFVIKDETPEPPQYSFKAHWTDDKRIGVVACVTRPDGGVHLLQTIIDPPSEQEQRQWVGLTGLEQKAIMAMNSRNAVFETEAKLKERNHG